jgi:hypothetical protein
MIKMKVKNNSLKHTAYSFLKFFICFVLITFVAAGCWDDTDDDDKDDHAGYDSPFEWPITIAYYYNHSGASGLLLSEWDDNNYDGNIDAVWDFEHDNNGKLESYTYDENNDGTNDWNGEYFYEGGDSDNCMERLVQTSVDASEELRWEYTFDVDCNRETYILYENDVATEHGEYFRDSDGNLLELVVPTLGTWYYTVGISGKPLSYEYDNGSNNSIDRVGTYHYDVDNDPDQKLMYLYSRERP